jgi:hypothetical protein
MKPSKFAGVVPTCPERLFISCFVPQPVCRTTSITASKFSVMVPQIKIGKRWRLDSELTIVAIGMDGFRATSPWLL